ncbi:MAG: glycosyltransferase [Candidatus Hydrogenedentota bacterium]
MKITAIIPSIRDETRLVNNLKNQIDIKFEIEIIKNVYPNGKARNTGISKHPDSDVYIFLDDDIELNRNDLLKQMIDGLEKLPEASACGIVRSVPEKGVNWFQQRIGHEVPLYNITPPSEFKLCELPLKGKYWLLISTTCIAIKKHVFDKIGLFREDMPKGVDTEFFYRMALANLKFTVVPNVTIEHYPPATLVDFIKTHFYYGFGHAFESKLYPHRGIGYPQNVFILLLFFVLRLLFFPIHIFLPYSAFYKRYFISFCPFIAIASLSSFFGYCYFFLKAENKHIPKG